MKNLITIITFVSVCCLPTASLPQNQTQHRFQNQTQAVVQTKMIVFSDGDMIVYCSTTPGKADTYYALNKKGKHVAVNVDGSKVIPASTTTATAKKGTSTTPAYQPPTRQ
ncbi:MAG: hypothetical protein IPN94_19925 [Sphingobacteriales bacterium]|nr:hypothetical protein [Sphingobacteriales bacterium]